MRRAGETALLAVLGHPVSHSLSPAMHGAAIAALGLDAFYTALDVPPERLPEVLAAAWTLGFRGLNLTIPHKEAGLPLAAAVTDAARRIGAVNTLVRTPDGWLGDNTDGAGWRRSLEEETGARIGGARVALLGAGGAARAILDTLLAGGCDVTVYNRDPARAEALCRHARGVWAGAGVRPEALGAFTGEGIDVLVHATPVGMHGEGAGRMPCAAAALRPGMVVSDLVYRPQVTPLLSAARERGAVAHGGLGMLVHQGALAFECWFGRTPPAAAMRAAVSAGLAAD